MAFLLEGEADETLAAALAFLDEQQKPSTLAQPLDADKELAAELDLSDNGPELPSLDDPAAADVLDALSAELPAPADKAIKNINWIPTTKLISQRRFSRRQVAPCPPPRPATAAALGLPTKPAKAPSPAQKKPYVRKKPLGYNPNKARDERKLELTYLRQTVADMEMELQKLQEIKGAIRDNTDSESGAESMSLVSALTANHNSCYTDDGVPQTCYIITPDLSDQSLNDDAKTGALTEFVLSSTAANISASNEMIENVLLDQALQQRKRSD
ncbi:hypothetical protein PHYPSEUDO_009734 [Phytophthora pseudosyringae]|uniref:Uncharacterized protein n=1 Tax=Phytophthora pseudosyringae TaxID=221518 RepID=A0A8T1VGX5_9STRA|nr:hypothetical protein PHYPSEUDO_009734 [Phytophthora pseudosyringae]